jgi:hypothetical protein
LPAIALFSVFLLSLPLPLLFSSVPAPSRALSVLF